MNKQYMGVATTRVGNMSVHVTVPYDATSPQTALEKLKSDLNRIGFVGWASVWDMRIMGTEEEK